VKAWIYKGDIFDGGARASLRSEPEPRRLAPRRERKPAAAPAPAAAEAPSGPPVQPAPGELPHPARTAAPVVPPLAPPQPSWKQELEPHKAGAEDTGQTEGTSE
jgi:hypothetical protein